MAQKPCNDDRLDKIEGALYGNDGSMGAIHQIKYAAKAIDDHVLECRETRKEMRKWFMGIIGTVIGGIVLATALWIFKLGG